MELQLERRGQKPRTTEPQPNSVARILPEHSASLLAFVVPRLLRIQDAAKYLSATIWQIETLLREKKIPSFVLGKRRVVDRLELDRYVERRNAEAKAALGDDTT
jgi:excisionase family DNA binding protein